MAFLSLRRQLLATALLTTALLTTSCQPSKNQAAEGTQAPETAIANQTTDGDRPSQPNSPTANPTIAQPNGSAQPSATTPVSNPSPTSKPAEPAPVVQLSAEGLPKTGILRNVITGDLQCYLELEDDQGKLSQVGASFLLCRDQPLNQRVELTYKQGTINDCQSIEPCGKSREAMQVSKIRFLETNAISSADITHYKNDNWSVSVMNSDSWDGINNTGNLSYYGCDANGNCISLSGGTMSCRDGQCMSGWRNGDYGYSITSQMGGEETTVGDGLVRLRVVDGQGTIVDEQLAFMYHKSAR